MSEQDVQLPPDAPLYAPSEHWPLLFRIYDESIHSSADIVSSWATTPRKPEASFLRECNPVTHIGRWRKDPSPWISTTRSFAYIMYELDRRSEQKGHVHSVAVIDPSHPSMKTRCMCAESLLRLYGDPCDGDYKKAQNYSTCFKEVLVYDRVPTAAIVVTLEASQLKDAFPQFVDVHIPSFKPSKFQAYNVVIWSLRSGEQNEDPDVLTSDATDAGIALVSSIFRGCSTRADLTTAVEHVFNFCYSILDWLPVHIDADNIKGLRDKIKSHPTYARGLTCIEDAELASQMAEIPCLLNMYLTQRKLQRLVPTADTYDDLANAVFEARAHLVDSLSDVVMLLQSHNGLSHAPSVHHEALMMLDHAKDQEDTESLTLSLNNLTL